MKKLLIATALIGVSSFAFADGFRFCGICETGTVNVGAPQIQVTVMDDSSSKAIADAADAKASNNMSSNTYGVALRAPSIQITALQGTDVLAKADGNGAKAQNNMASNVGDVAVNAPQLQLYAARNSYVAAVAHGRNSTAIQNFSSNNACLSCQ